MPFPALIAPVLLWGAAATAAAVGVKKGVDAYSDNSKAEEVGKKAERKFKEAQSKLDEKRAKTESALEDLGRAKLAAFTNQIKHLVDMQEKFKSRLQGFKEGFKIENLDQCKQMVLDSVKLEEAVGTGAGGALTGGLAALGAYGAVGALATTAGGTAIGSLTGVAATNATLAWLGGGSLAAGGFGMAGGMVALGGIAVAPLLAIGGFWAAAKAEEKLTKAKEYAADVDVAVEKMATLKETLKAIRTAAREEQSVIEELCQRFDQYKVDDMSDEQAFEKMMLIGVNLKKVLDVPILHEDGTVVDNIRSRLNGYLEIS
ncbi:MAG: hypothetical protein IJ228_08035 [Succinivibrio sp.]|nr:hypothetical protein [Succinivibrio sp.]